MDEIIKSIPSSIRYFFGLIFILCLLALVCSVVVEVIESTERIEQILPRLDEMVEGGLITLEKVRVILYRAAKK